MSGYPEQLVARAAGVNRRALVAVRKRSLAKGPHWVMVDGQVCYTADGLGLLCSALKFDVALVEAEKIALEKARAAVPAEVATGAAGSLAEASASPGGAVSSGISPAGKEAGAHEVDDDNANRSPSGPAVFARRDPAATVAEVLAGRVEEIAQGRPEVEVRVTRAQLPNRRVVHGVRLDTGAHVVVRVRDNANFVAGLVVRAVSANGQSYYNQVGRPPRWRGDRFGFTARAAKENSSDE